MSAYLSNLLITFFQPLIIQKYMLYRNSPLADENDPDAGIGYCIWDFIYQESSEYNKIKYLFSPARIFQE